MDFKTYITQTRELIAKKRQGQSFQEPVIDYNSPYIQTPNGNTRIGVLLVHGLLDSCFAMRDIGDVLHEQSCLTHSILLPGHGTVPADLINIHYEDWLQAVKFGVDALKGKVDQILIAGNSTGASLALLHAYTHQDVDGLLCFAPACKISDKLAFLTGPVGWFGRFWHRLNYLAQFPEDDCVKYRSMALNAAWQVYRLSKRIKNISLNIPLYFAMSAQDEVVHFNESLHFFKRQTNAHNFFHVFSNEPADIKHSQIKITNSALPEKHIIALSHPGLVYKPDNPHYGEHGVYTQKIITTLKPDLFGNVYMPKRCKDGKRLTRLQYNPLFNEMTKTIVDFIQKL